MIEFNYIFDYQIDREDLYKNWLLKIVLSEKYTMGELSYVFCNDNYLLSINQKYLSHDTFTDIITFDYTDQGVISGDIFISIERVKENAFNYSVSFENELRRVMSHGLLHLFGYGDKSKEASVIMRKKEEEKMELFHVEH